jgi:hypothetical protein
MSIFKSFTYSLAVAIAFTAFGQTVSAQQETGELTKPASTAEAVVEKTTEAEKIAVTLDEEGKLNGNVFLKNEEKQPVDAKITLSHDGVVVDTVEANEEGVFSFASIEPGSYQMTGISDSYIGGQSFDVAPFGGSGCPSCDLGLSNGFSSDVMYDSYSAAPCNACNSCNTCGGGGLGSRLGGGGFGGGGFGGGGLLSRPLLLGGITGGIIAIASGGDDEMSPTE